MATARAGRAAARGAATAAGELPSTEVPPEAVCIVCLDRGDEALLRNCACRGSMAGYAHIECLAQYAAAARHKPELWTECGTCKQRFFGATQLGLARARLERARGLPEQDTERLNAMNDLALALTSTGEYASALPLFEEVLAVRRRTIHAGSNLHTDTLTSMFNLADLHNKMERPDLALPLAEDCRIGRWVRLGLSLIHI